MCQNLLFLLLMVHVLCGWRGPALLDPPRSCAPPCGQVVVLEQGQPVEVRGKDIGALFARRKLNPTSNLSYGEGGAGAVQAPCAFSCARTLTA